VRYDSHHRNTDPELMDDPSVPAADLQQAVDDINRINRLLGGFGFTRRAVQNLLQTTQKQHVTIVDAGCGDGEMLRYLDDHISDGRVSFLGLDFSGNSILSAREKSKGRERVSFRESDILNIQPDDLDSDILISSLTMHHFNDDEVVEWLKKFKQITRCAIIINDLQRHRLAYVFFKVFGKVLTRHPISYHDGLVSIASGFKRRDLEKYAAAAGIERHEIQWKWSFRYIWTIHLDEC
jgi:SAM-dependent methyltransferase